MKKDALLLKKRKIVNKMCYPYNYLFYEEENIKMFSCYQLEKIAEITQKGNEIKNDKSPFFVLSATEVLQKESGRIAYFTDDGIMEETEEEILSGASRKIYEKYKRLDVSGNT